jgi:hypothetical protein
VARAIAHLTPNDISAIGGKAWRPPPGVTIKIRKIVLVATPNAGTVLAEEKGIAGLIDRCANVINLLPDTVLVIAGGALLAIAASMAQVTFRKLPGLVDQTRGSELQEALGATAAKYDSYYAFSANYEPDGNLAMAIQDGAMDIIFKNEKNDLVVPSDGVAHTPYYELPSARHVAFGSARGVHHGNFFEQEEMGNLLAWLA